MKKLVLIALFAPTLALAQPTLNLTADATSKVPNDEMVVSLAIERSGADSAPLTDAVLTALTEATKAARSVAGIEVRQGNVSTNPNWDQNKKIGWQVRGEMTLMSKDMKALSALTGKLSEKLQLAGVSFRLSESSRSAEEARLINAAADNFRAKAKAATSAFGYSNFVLNEVTVSQAGSVMPPRPMMAMSMKAERAGVPVEGGDSEVSVTISGKVELLR
jgi:predicted secreted protein